MNANDVADSHEGGQLLLRVGKEGYRDTSIVGVASVTGLLIVHGRVHDFEELAEEVFLRVRARSIDHDTIQVVELGIAKASLC